MPPRLVSNRGGGCVDDYQVTADPFGGHVLRIAGPVGAVTQVRLADPRYLPRAGHPSELVGADGAPLAITVELLDVLRGVLTLPTARAIDFAIALDWTKTPQDGVDPRNWPNTHVYDLVHRGKYRYRSPTHKERQAEVGRAVAHRLSDFMQLHPLLRRAHIVVAAPGHDSRVASFGARLAATVARDRSLRFVACRSITEFRTPAKDLDPSQRAAAITNQFTCGENLSGLNAVIVDDLYSSGTTAGEAARALRVAGAATVAVLTPARTLRS